MILLVDHIESYKQTLAQRISGARSSLKYLAPDKQSVRTKVNSMIQNITGEATETVATIISKKPQPAINK